MDRVRQLADLVPAPLLAKRARWVVLLLLGTTSLVAGAQRVPPDDLASGIRLYRSGRTAEAVSALDRAIAELAGDPARARDLAQANLYMGLSRLAQGRSATIVKAHFRTAIEKDPLIAPGELPAGAAAIWDAARAEAVEMPGVKRVLALRTGPAGTGTFGLRGLPLSDAQRKAKGLPSFEGGLVVTMVVAGGPAAGVVEKGDVLRRLNDAELHAPWEIVLAARARSPATEVRLELWRDGRPNDVVVEVWNEEPLLREGCERGDPVACLLQAESSRGAPLGEASVRAVESFDAGCGKGFAPACSDAGWAYLSGLGRPQDVARAAALFKQGCDAGDADGCYALGFLYEVGKNAVAAWRGQGYDRDPVQAALLLGKACDGGSAPACSSLARHHRTASGLGLGEAARLERLACSWGDGAACRELALALSRGIGVARDVAAADEALKRAAEVDAKACEAGAGRPCLDLAEQVRSGRGVAREPARVAGLLRRACDGGVADGCAALAWAFMSGVGIDKDPLRARQYLDLACRAGSDAGCVGLATAHRFALGVGTAETPSEAVPLYERACNLGSPSSCESAARMRRNGEGVPKDTAGADALVKRAQALFRDVCELALADEACLGLAAYETPDAPGRLEAACSRGSDSACLGLAGLFEQGRTVAKDKSRADALYQKVRVPLLEECRRGRGESCRRLGELERDGKGGAPDPSGALQRFLAACDAGDGDGCESAGSLLWEGTGAPKDRARAGALGVRALALYSASCTAGDSYGCYSEGYSCETKLFCEQGRSEASYRAGCEQGDNDSCLMWRATKGTQRVRVWHRHGGYVVSQCRGVLSIGRNQLEYRADDGQHRFSWACDSFDARRGKPNLRRIGESSAQVQIVSKGEDWAFWPWPRLNAPDDETAADLVLASIRQACGVR